MEPFNIFALFTRLMKFSCGEGGSSCGTPKPHNFQPAKNSSGAVNEDLDSQKEPCSIFLID